MKEVYAHCTKYNKWIKKGKSIKTPIICPECENLEKTNCENCKFSKIEWVEDE